jgi:hypothetical protein
MKFCGLPGDLPLGGQWGWACGVDAGAARDDGSATAIAAGQARWGRYHRCRNPHVVTAMAAYVPGTWPSCGRPPDERPLCSVAQVEAGTRRRNTALATPMSPIRGSERQPGPHAVGRCFRSDRCAVPCLTVGTARLMTDRTTYSTVPIARACGTGIAMQYHHYQDRTDV